LVSLDQPFEDNGGIQTTGIGQNDFFYFFRQLAPPFN
jgi:hypothetical protein